MASRPPPASTPIHPRLLELTAQAVDSPFSTPDSAVTASSADKTRCTEEDQVSGRGIADDYSSNHDSSGESLGIRAARPRSPGFVDAALSPPGTTSDSESSKTEKMDGKNKSSDASASSASPDARLGSSSGSNPLEFAQPDSLLNADQPQGGHCHHDHAREKAGQPKALASADNHVADPVKDPAFVSGFKSRVANFYSPPPPSLGGASLKRGDYYSDSATSTIPSPRLEPIAEASTELSTRYKAAMMAETPLKQVPHVRHTALLNRRATPYAAALHQDTPDTSQSPADSSARLSTPSNKTAATFNDSMFESPLLAPMAPYGSPIRFNNAGAALLQGNQAPPHSVERSPVSVPLNKRLAIKRPPGLDAPSPLKREEAKIRDMLWRSPVQEDDDTDDVDILPPEVEQLGPPSPYAVHFDKALINDPKSPNKVSDSQAVPVNTPGTDLSKPTALSRTHSQPGPNGNLNKIPTLVGPNSLPYARCPSGIDSFAFDIQNPRPYDAIMPLDKGYTLPKSISCDDKLLFRAIANPLIPNNEDEELAVSSKIGSGKSDQVESSKPVNQPIYSTANYASTTHNERARQRMERVKMATTKREQARMEEQNRREVARITRKLIAEQEVRREAMLHNDRPTAAQYRQLNSRAEPFMPKSPQIASFDHAVRSGRESTLSTVPTVLHAHAVLPDFVPAIDPTSTFSNIAEARQTQNRLLSILQQRMQGIQLAPTAHNGVHQPHSNKVQPYASLPSLPEGHGPGVLSAINTMMHTNQQLISMLQETERLLSRNTVDPSHGRYALSGLESEWTQTQHTGLQQEPLQHPSAAYRFPADVADSQAKQTVSQAATTSTPNVSISADPAVVHSQRRKSVTFDESSMYLPDVRGNVSMPTIPVSLTKALPALSRSVHELPPRPTQIEISQKVMGIMPTEDAAKVQDQISHKADTKPAHGVLSNSTSTIDQSEAEARRQNRSNAPSPECFTTVKSKTQRPVGPNPLAKLVPHKVSQIKQRNASVKGSTRQPMAEKAANISISSAANEKSPKQKRKSGPGESKNVKGGADHKSKTRRSDCRDDKNWMAFVREMGGVPQLSSSTR